MLERIQFNSKNLNTIIFFDKNRISAVDVMHGFHNYTEYESFLHGETQPVLINCFKYEDPHLKSKTFRKLVCRWYHNGKKHRLNGAAIEYWYHIQNENPYYEMDPEANRYYIFGVQYAYYEYIEAMKYLHESGEVAFKMHHLNTEGVNQEYIE